MTNEIPTYLIIRILPYLNDADFRYSILINKSCQKYLLEEYQKRYRKHYFIKIILDPFINREICFSNIQLRKVHGGRYNCKSKRDYKNGSIFCSFCNYVLSK